MSSNLFGFLPIDKPRGMTSRGVVDCVKRHVKPAKAGHTGTLDPLAEGLLVVCIGPATRLASFVQQTRKSYIGEFLFGAKSDTDDADGRVEEIPNAPTFSEDQLRTIIPEFLGHIQQVPPAYSAVKIQGKRAYKLARDGKKPLLQPRDVKIYDMELLRFQYPHLKLKVECGAGTYIRSLGRDLGKRLGSGAVMTSLIRQSVGTFDLNRCIDVDGLSAERIQQNIIAPADIFPDLCRTHLNPDQITRLKNGGAFAAGELGLKNGLKRVVALDEASRLLALLRSANGEDHQYRIEYNFANHYTQEN